MENSHFFDDIRKKFGLLIYYLIESGISYEMIQNKIIKDPFFLCFENNHVDNFIDSSIDEIIRNVFGKKVYLDYSKSVTAEIVWAGQMYVTILANYGVPIQRSFLVYPLEKMISLFNPYHEMSDYYLCKRYLEDENKTSVLKLLIDNQMSVRQLSLVTGISKNTLQSYLSNERLFSSSIDAALKLANYFNVPVVVFSKESNYCPDISLFFKDAEFKNIYLSLVCEYYSLQVNRIYVSKEEDDKNVIKSCLENNKVIVDIYHSRIVKKHNNKITYINFDNQLKKSFAFQSLKQFKNNKNDTDLFF